MDLNIIDLSGNSTKKITSKLFDEPYRPDLVKKRGHQFSASLPLVVADELSALTRTKDVKSFLEAAKLWDDILRAKQTRVRAGKGKLRGRRYKTPKSILIVTAQDNGVVKAARNLAGVDVCLLYTSDAADDLLCVDLGGR